jgi:hypothetical protein
MGPKKDHLSPRMSPASSINKNLFGSLYYAHRFMGLLVGALYCITYHFMCVSFVAC